MKRIRKKVSQHLQEIDSKQIQHFIHFLASEIVTSVPEKNFFETSIVEVSKKEFIENFHDSKTFKRAIEYAKYVFRISNTKLLQRRKIIVLAIKKLEKEKKILFKNKTRAFI